jgi:hypothetical protein
MRSDAATVEQYLAELDDERRAEVELVYRTVRDAMPAGYTESMAWGMITWSVPLDRYPDTYNGQPLCYVSLAAQKRHNALYLMGLYADSGEAKEFRDRWTEDGRRLDMGKSCLRFKRADDLRLDLIAETVAATPPDGMIALHERAQAAARPGRGRQSPTAL